MNLGITLLEAIATAAGAAILAGLVAIVRMLIGIKGSLDHLVPSVMALYDIQFELIEAGRCNNESLTKLGANGSTDKGNACLDRAESKLNRRLVERVGGQA
jgi:hypothetical protein